MERNNGERAGPLWVSASRTVFFIAYCIWTTKLQQYPKGLFSLWLCFLVLAFVPGIFIWSFCSKTQFAQTTYMSPLLLFTKNMRLSLMCPHPLLPWLSSAGSPACYPPSLGPHSWLQPLRWLFCITYETYLFIRVNISSVSGLSLYAIHGVLAMWPCWKHRSWPPNASVGCR